MQAHSCRQRGARSAGFTLVELMTVVAITGILATLGVMLVRNHFKAAKATRAVLGLQAIRVAEEANRAQTGEYRDCAAAYYPRSTPDATKVPWRQSDMPVCWRALSVQIDTTEYVYKVDAGRPGDIYPDLETADDPPLPNPALDLWYVIQVQGNLDGDSTPMRGVLTSFSGDAYLENENE